MRAGASPVGDAGQRGHDDGSSWAFSVNETARHDDVEITLLTCSIVDDLVRVTGLFRFRNHDFRLASIPPLSVSGPGGRALTSVSAHVLPHGRIAWVSWLFERPATVLGAFEAHIDTVSVDYQVRRRPPEEHPGPWVFRFELPPTPAAAKMIAALDD